MNLCKRFRAPRAVQGKSVRGRRNSNTSVAAEINIFCLIAHVTDKFQTNMNLTFRGMCIVKYSCNKGQQDALFLNFISVNNSTCLSETCRVVYQNKVEKQRILLAFIIRIQTNNCQDSLCKVLYYVVIQVTELQCYPNK